MADLLSTAHFGTIGLTVATGLLTERIKSMRRIFEDYGVSTILRADFKPSSRTELLHLLRRFRNVYDVVAVRCVNQQVATVSCRDRRVDVVFFNAGNRNLRFTHTFARLLRGAVEFNLVSDLVDPGDAWALARMRKAVAIAKEHRANVVLSSGARNYLMVRSPIQMSALGIILGLTQAEAISAVSSTPSAIVTDNRRKRSPEYVEEGVRIVLPSRR